MTMKYAISVKKLKARERELKREVSPMQGILASHYDQVLDGVVIKGS